MPPLLRPLITLSRNLRLHHHHPRHHTTTTTSVNPTEIHHFNALASTWWDPHGPSRLLHLMNPLRHDFITTCLSPSPPPSSSPITTPPRRYLDIGCGGGIFAESAARLPSTTRVLAIDPSASVIGVAKQHARTDPTLMLPDRLVYANKSVEQLPVPRVAEEQFDIVTLFEVIEHVDRPGDFLKACMPFVKPGGWLVLSTIARTWVSWLTTKVVAEDVVGLVPQGTHEWGKYVNEEELRGFFEGKEGWGGGNGGVRSQGVMFLPGIGWRVVAGGERWGNYFFGVRREEGGGVE